MVVSTLNDLCERGQTELMETSYLQAANTLSEAEELAWNARQYDTLARLYLPLQEARRQIRQRCGEGAVRLHLIATGPETAFDADQILRDTPQGQFLIAGWQTAQPAMDFRKLANERRLYAETFLASVQPSGTGAPLIKILPVDEATDDTMCLIMPPDQIPADAAVGNAASFAGVMDLWERLHTPFLARAAAEPDPVHRMQAYRLALRVDPACELAHQFLAEIARKLSRG